MTNARQKGFFQILQPCAGHLRILILNLDLVWNSASIRCFHMSPTMTPCALLRHFIYLKAFCQSFDNSDSTFLTAMKFYTWLTFSHLLGTTAVYHFQSAQSQQVCLMVVRSASGRTSSCLMLLVYKECPSCRCDPNKAFISILVFLFLFLPDDNP